MPFEHEDVWAEFKEIAYEVQERRAQDMRDRLPPEARAETTAPKSDTASIADQG